MQRQLDEAKQDQKDAHRAVNFLFSILNQLPVGLTVQSEDGRPLFINEMAAEYVGSLSAPRDAAPAAPGASGGDKPAASAPSSAAAIIENRVAGANGERTLLECRRSARVLDQPALISTALDFTERKQAEIELSKRAYFDDLAGLPNRTLIQEHVEHLLTKTQTPSRFALAFIDIDNFKHINDYYTHAGHFVRRTCSAASAATSFFWC